MDKTIYIFIINLILSLQCCCSLEGNLEIFDLCSPEGHVCLKQESCPQLNKAIKNGFRPKLCSFIGKEPVICCEDPPPLNIKDKVQDRDDEEPRISARMCDKYYYEICPNSVPFVQGGEPAEPKELPFMALIGYGPERNIDWRCAGTLISPKYVLSAAHCSRTDTKPLWVRLGELDYTTNLDNAKPQNFRITRIYDHPNYKYPEAYNDITLYQLNRDAVLNDYVRPICLNQSPILNRGAKPVVGAGWGRTEFGGPTSKRLLRVALELFDPDGCYREEYAKQLPHRIDNKSILCAGSREGGKDTCGGDSGGPLFYKPSRDLVTRQCFLYTQVGITSFGYQCGLKDYPALYTNVYNFLPWIESIVWPSKVTDSGTIWNK